MNSFHRFLFLTSLFLSSSLLPIEVSSFPHFFPNISSIPFSNATSAAWDSFHKLAGCHPGENVPGLSKLKQYFRQFGYINNSSIANFTDDFDNLLQSALKTYQLNFNINSTGELDEKTMQQILRPRCGVADIVNGTSTMKSGKSPVHLNVVAHYTFFPGSPRWPDSQTELTYAFLPENGLDDTVKAVFGTAFDRWSEVTPLTFTETASYLGADIRIGFYTGNHGDGEPFDGVLGTLAHAFSPPSGQLHLDGDENWVLNGNLLASPAASAVDLESVVVHEIGHLLGLGHSSEEDAIMFPTIPSGSRKVELAGDDIEGIQSLYGSNPNYVGSPNPTLQERNSVNFVRPTLSHMFILAIGLILFIL